MEKKRFIFTISICGVGETEEEAYSDAHVKLKDMNYMDEVVEVREEPFEDICTVQLLNELIAPPKEVQKAVEKIADELTEVERKMKANTCAINGECKWICDKCHACACNECFTDGKCHFCGYTVRILYDK